VDDVIGVYSVTSTEAEELRTELWKTVLPRVRAEIMQKFSVPKLYPTFPIPVIFISGNQVRFIMKKSPDTASLNLTLYTVKKVTDFLPLQAEC
jgi:hypothetical protein